LNSISPNFPSVCDAFRQDRTFKRALASSGASSQRDTRLRRRLLAIANPSAGRRNRGRLEETIARLGAFGCVVELVETEGPGDAERAAAAADQARFDAVVAAGGDGTINEVLNGMTAEAPPLAVLPLGTANVLAAELGLPRSIEAIAQTIAFGEPRRIALGEANGRRFAMMASAGLDAHVVQRLSLKLKRRIGKTAYVIETLRQAMIRPPLAYRLRLNGVEEEASGVIVSNGRRYGGPFIIAPKADLTSPSFEVCRLTRSGRLAGPSYLLSAVRGRLAERSDVRIDTAERVEILGPSGAPLQADGDLLCRLPVVIRALPAAVALIFPVVA
jgi:YegS/Rv2252/BmrU family lipid kinase